MLFSSLPSPRGIFRLENLRNLRNQVYRRGQLLGLWLQAEYSFTDVTRRQGWSARLGRERSRPRGRCGGQHQLAAAAHRRADRQLDIVLPLFAG